MALSTVHLMRHGEAVKLRVRDGRLPDSPLSPRGHATVVRVAEVLSGGGHNIRAVVASPLLRAQESAAPIAHAFGVPVQTDVRLSEARIPGEGVDIGARPPHPFPRLRAAPLHPESHRDKVNRMARAIRSALSLIPDGGEVLAVSHQLPIWVTRRFIERRLLVHRPERRQCAPASLTTLTFDGRRLVALTYWEPAADRRRGSHGP